MRPKTLISAEAMQEGHYMNGLVPWPPFCTIIIYKGDQVTNIVDFLASADIKVFGRT